MDHFWCAPQLMMWTTTPGVSSRRVHWEHMGGLWSEESIPSWAWAARCPRQVLLGDLAWSCLLETPGAKWAVNSEVDQLPQHQHTMIRVWVEFEVHKVYVANILIFQVQVLEDYIIADSKSPDVEWQNKFELLINTKLLKNNDWK